MSLRDALYIFHERNKVIDAAKNERTHQSSEVLAGFINGLGIVVFEACVRQGRVEPVRKQLPQHRPVRRTPEQPQDHIIPIRPRGGADIVFRPCGKRIREKLILLLACSEYYPQ